MSHPRISLKNRWLAAVLAFLVPGAGHFYQGRYFKGAIYFLCIVPTFLFGMHLGEWKVTYWLRDPTTILNPYYAQFWVGLPALPSLVQSRRYRAADKAANASLEAPVSASFQGTLRNYQRDAGVPVEGPLDGQITLEPVDPASGRIRGDFQGTLRSANGDEQIELRLGGVPKLDAHIGADEQRKIVCDVVSEKPGEESRSNGKVSGTIPRSFWNWFQVPPSEAQVQDLNRRLGKMLELAQIFTMIAGLLNILAIWDALEGPAYGYGDSHPRRDEQNAPGTKAVAQSQPSPRSDGGRAAERVQVPVGRSGAG